ncbi:acyl-CoA dehydrogenase family protein [Comamonas humi]
MDHLIVDALRDLLADQCTPGAVRAIESEAASADTAGATGQNALKLWQAISESGFADLLVAEEAGGAGLALRDVFAVLELLGQHALPLPLAETLLARAWCAQQGVAAPDGVNGLVAFAPQAVLSAQELLAPAVRGARCAGWVLAAAGGEWRLLSVAQAQAAPGIFALDAELRWPRAAWDAAPVLSAAADLHTAQAGLYAALLAGALQNVFHRTLQFANERQQFGRAIGKFQAIQHELSIMAEHVSSARMAAQIGCESADLRFDALKVAVAKARASEAAVEVASLAHSIHGAIGFTAEFDLQLFTRRLHLWRQTAGAESFWQLRAGQALVAHPGMTLDLVRQVTDRIAA